MHSLTSSSTSMEVERVQAVAKMFAGRDMIPRKFIRWEHEQPGLTTYKGTVPDIPVVDLAAGLSEEVVVAAVVKASEDWGIFQVVEHGIPTEVIGELQRVGREFFELPEEEKKKYTANFEGYGTKLQKGSEGKKAWVDYFYHNVWPPAAVNYAIWPINPPDYRKANEVYTQHLIGVVDKLLGALSIGLGMKDNTLKEAMGGEDLEYLLKINYYPPCPRPDLALGVASHTDMSAITMLVPNKLSGLQVFKDKHWIDVKCNPGAIIVHIGDQIEILSNGKYKSVLHRTTVSKDKMRMSWPVFCSPPPETVIGPLPDLVSRENRPKFKTKKYKDYAYCNINKIPQ